MDYCVNPTCNKLININDLNCYNCGNFNLNHDKILKKDNAITNLIPQKNFNKKCPLTFSEDNMKVEVPLEIIKDKIKGENENRSKSIIPNKNLPLNNNFIVENSTISNNKIISSHKNDLAQEKYVKIDKNTALSSISTKKDSKTIDNMNKISDNFLNKQQSNDSNILNYSNISSKSNAQIKSKINNNQSSIIYSNNIFRKGPSNTISTKGDNKNPSTNQNNPQTTNKPSIKSDLKKSTNYAKKVFK